MNHELGPCRLHVSTRPPAGDLIPLPGLGYISDAAFRCWATLDDGVKRFPEVVSSALGKAKHTPVVTGLRDQDGGGAKAIDDLVAPAAKLGDNPSQVLRREDRHVWRLSVVSSHYSSLIGVKSVASAYGGEFSQNTLETSRRLRNDVANASGQQLLGSQRRSRR